VPCGVKSRRDRIGSERNPMFTRDGDHLSDEGVAIARREQPVAKRPVLDDKAPELVERVFGHPLREAIGCP
jgi:hypothetical protein